MNIPINMKNDNIRDAKILEMKSEKLSFIFLGNKIDNSNFKVIKVESTIHNDEYMKKIPNCSFVNIRVNIRVARMGMICAIEEPVNNMITFL